MSDPGTTQSTLPSLVTALPGLRQENQLIATIIYHPDLSRIGEYALIPRSRTPVVLGRDAVGFRRSPDADKSCLDEPYVSRRALCLEFTQEGLLLQRDASASRCRVNGMELEQALLLEAEDLARGVAVLLAHTVVLWLAEGPERHARHPFCDEDHLGQ